MNRIDMLLLALNVAASAFLASQASAESAGDPATGKLLAGQLCAECHAVEVRQAPSPNSAAPPFEVIANVPGMTSIALAAALQTSHKIMPNVLLGADQLDNVVAYILSLKRVD